MAYRYAVIGSGRQGTAAAYDLALLCEAQVVLMADADIRQAERACQRVNRLLGAEVALPRRLDAARVADVSEFLRSERVDAFLSAVPYYFNLDLTEAAISAGCGMTDLGGNSQVVLEQLAMSPQAARAGATVVPDCGQVPGMGTTLILYAMEQLDQAQDVFMWDCGLPQDPQPPWNYSLTFSIEGLTNEYYGDCLFLRDGRLAHIPALTERETITFGAGIGTLEGFTTSGGLTTAARSYEGRLRTLQNKTLRYPGHFDQLKVLEQLGLLEIDPVQVDGQAISPRQVLHTLWEPQIRAAADTRDFILIHIHALGKKDGLPAKAVVQLHHLYDEKTGFTGMEQGTGWHASIITHAIARGEVQAGVIPIEEAMTGTQFVERARKRGFEVDVHVEPPD